MSNFWTAGVVPVCHHRPGQSESCVASRRDPGYTLVLARAARDVEPKLKAVPALTTDTDDDEEEEEE